MQSMMTTRYASARRPLPHAVDHTRRTRVRMLLTAVVTTALLAGCGAVGVVAGVTDEPGPPVATSTVQVVDNDFDPPDAELAVGDTMTWRWEGEADHNVVGDGFESPVQNDGTFEHRFTQPGTYTYRCTLHGGMQGTVTVVAAVGTGS